MNKEITVHGENGIFCHLDIGLATHVFFADDIRIIGGLIENEFNVIKYHPALRDNDYIVSIRMADSVKFIGDKAFENCINLKSVIMSKNITRIGHNAFMNCAMLSSIDIYPSLLVIGDNCFEGCVSLNTINYHGTQHQFKNVIIGQGHWLQKTKIKTTDGTIYFDETPITIK